jgi:hypothetical protein
MQHGPNTNMRMRQPSFAARSKRWPSGAVRPEQKGSHNAQRNYERYLALAQAEARAGDRIAAESHYQHAEHYFRMMSSDRDS